MKISKYNLFKESSKNKGEYIAYNSFTNSLAVLDKGDYDSYKAFANNNSFAMEEELMSNFIKGGFIIEDDYNEDEVLQYKMQSSRYDNSALNLTIAPTLDCNFRCAYCYEKKRYENVVMEDKVADAILEYISGQSHKIDKLNINWYGGEPLIAFKVIEYLSQKILEICKENNIVYSASIVSNGFLLDENKAKKLSEFKVDTIQITLDGMEENHNSRRPLKGGGKTFERIMSNLQWASKYIDTVTIRVNCDKNNISEYINLYKIIKSKGYDNVFMYPSPIRNVDGCYKEDSCFIKNDFKEVEFELYKELGEEVFSRFINGRYPERTDNICGADYGNSAVISAGGDMYKCWSDIGDKNLCFGNITDTKNIDINKYIVYFRNTPVNGEKCMNCSIYPICLGGCPYERRVGMKDTCEYSEKLLWRYLEEMV